MHGNRKEYANVCHISIVCSLYLLVDRLAEIEFTKILVNRTAKCPQAAAFPTAPNKVAAMKMDQKFLFIGFRLQVDAEWIHAIRRDEGKHFQITKWTKVCSRHFRQYDFIQTLNGRGDVRPDAVPSLFAWTRTSPRKRKAPVFQVFTKVNSPNVSMQSQVTSDEEPNDTCTLPTTK